MRIWPCVLFALAGCDRVLGLQPHPDAMIADAATICEHEAPFETMTRVAGLSDPMRGEVGLWLSLDELDAIVVIGGSQQTSRLVAASRGAPDAPFALGSDLMALNMRSTTVGSPVVSRDGLTIYFDAFYPSAAGYDIEAATRATLADAFSNPVPVPELNAPGGIYDSAPALGSRGDRIYWESSRSGEYDVWSATWSGSTWVDPRNVFAMRNYERSFVASDDDLVLYFSASANGLTDHEIRLVSRPDRDAMFGPPTLIRLPMSIVQTHPVWLSADHCRLYLIAAGDVWVATRVP